MIKTATSLPSAPLAQVARQLERIDAIAPDGFVELTSFASLRDGAGVERDSRLWAERFLQPGADPYRQDPAARRFAHHATDRTHDTLRHELRLEELRLAIHETVKVVLIGVELEGTTILGPGGEGAAAAIAAVAGRVLKRSGTYDDAFGQVRPYRWTFHYQPPLGEGARFSTAPEVDPQMLPSWTARVDGGIHRGKLFFLGYKAHVSGDGRLIFLRGRGWFDGSCWKAYA